MSRMEMKTLKRIEGKVDKLIQKDEEVHRMLEHKHSGKMMGGKLPSKKKVNHMGRVAQGFKEG